MTGSYLRTRRDPNLHLGNIIAPGYVTAQRPHATVGFDAEFERYAIHDRAGGFHGFRKTLDEAIDLADAIQQQPPPRVKPKPAPQPEERISPLAADRAIAADIDRAVRRQESRERNERLAARRRSRYRNRGTLG
jgi:hypothetical protein